MIVQRTVRVVICSFLVYFFGASVSSGQSSISIIEIKSEWGGLGEPQSSHLVIKQNDGRFYSGSRRLKNEDVKAFVDAVENSSPQKWGLDVLGVTGEWLTSNAAKALRGYLPEWQYKETSEKQKELFIDSFSNHDFMEMILTKGLSTETVEEEIDFDSNNSFGIDDFPTINIQITYIKGDRYLIKSTYDSNFISTWIIRSLRKTYRIHSAAISLGLWQITPRNFTNRERLSDDARRYELAERLMWHLRDEWDMLGAEEKLGSSIKPVQNRFILLHSRIANMSSIDLDGGSAWHATLHDSNLPSNVEIELSLPLLWNKEPIGVDKFLERIDKVVQLALSPVWFNRFIATHPDAQIQIRFVEDRSLSPKALQNIIQDLADLGKTNILQKISDAKDQVVFIELNDRRRIPVSQELSISSWSRWIVMPNREMVLWQFKSDKVGNWSENDFKTMDCYGWKCAGAIISDDGEILSP